MKGDHSQQRVMDTVFVSSSEKPQHPEPPEPCLLLPWGMGGMSPTEQPQGVSLSDSRGAGSWGAEDPPDRAMGLKAWQSLSTEESGDPETT